MDTTETIILGAALVGGVILLTGGKAGDYIGRSAGYAAVSATGGVVKGGFNALKDIKTWSEEQDYIPVIDEAVKASLWIKKIGNDNRWYW